MTDGAGGESARAPRAAGIVGVALFAGFGLWAAVVAARAEGILEADETLHWLYARHAPEEPLNFVHPWARPLYTLLLWPFSTAGFAGGRALSTLAALLCALGTWRAAAALGLRGAASAVAWCFAQPYFFQQTFGTWTEIVFAACAAWWAYGVAARRPTIAAAFASAAPLVRPEGAFLAFATGVAALCGALRDRDGEVARWRPIAILPVGVAAWWAASWALSGDPAWIVRNWPWKPDASYGRGDWLWLADLLPRLLPGALGVLAALGLFAPTLRRAAVVPGAALLVLGVHAYLWARGAFGSAGYARYFVTLAPCFALAAAAGTDLLFSNRVARRLRLDRAADVVAPLLAAGVAVLLLLNQERKWPVTPSDAPPDARVFAALGRALEADGARPLVYSAHPFAYLELSRFPTERFADLGDFRPEKLDAVPPGALLLVENRFFSTRPGNPPETDLPRLGFSPMPSPALDAARGRNDARHDPALDGLTWSLWKKKAPR